MSRFCSLSNDEIAHLLGLSVRTVEKHIQLALQDLRMHGN
jgi:DNA-directed RNA polymerase specialized sigma24 family protein